MKLQKTLLVGTALAVWSLAGISTVYAQGPRGGGRSVPSGGGGVVPDEKPPGLGDLGKAADRFQAWKMAKLDGAASFSKYDEEIRKEYQELVQKIEQVTMEDRLTGKKARGFLSEALKIEAAAAAGTESISDKIEALEEEVDSATTDTAKAETLSPKLNKLQWLIGETLMYGSKSGVLSDAKVSSINKKLISLEEKETKAKDDGELSDSEREKLEEGAAKIWKLIVKGLKGRDD